MESEIWMSFQTSRGANATLFLCVIIATWVAARFSSVMIDKGINIIGKILGSVFSLSVFAIGWNLFTNIGNQWILHANALAALGEESSPIAKAFVAEYGGELMTMPNPVGIAFLVSVFLIAILPLWIKTD
jgi:hypothetical protein